MRNETSSKKKRNERQAEGEREIASVAISSGPADCSVEFYIVDGLLPVFVW